MAVVVSSTTPLNFIEMNSDWTFVQLTGDSSSQKDIPLSVQLIAPAQLNSSLIAN